MKKLIVCTLWGLSVLVIFSCASAKKTGVQENKVEQSTAQNFDLQLANGFAVNGGSLQQISDHSFLKEKDEGSQITVTGLFAYGNPCVLVENPDGKNRVSFVVEIPEDLEEQCRELDGKTVILTGILTESKSTWSKKMTLLKIER